MRKETEVAGPGDDAPGAVGAGLPGPGHYGPVVGIGAATVLEFIDQARVAFPDAPAIRERNRAVTHAELDRLAARVATVLQRTYGIGRGATVAIVATAGVDFTAALLGTIRAGAAYLPIDLAYPKGRIEEIFQASGATLIMLAGDCRSSEYVTGPAAESVDLTRILAEPATGEPRRPAAAAEAGDPAYVIFTSGSTGTPKGIVQTHRCLANFVAWQVNASGLGRGRRILQSAPLSFDVSVQEIFYALASGGCLCVPDPEEKLDPRDLLAYMIAQDIEVIDFPQSLIDTIMLLPENFRHAPALRHIISAGETVRVTPMLEALLHDRPEVTLYNHYGPAENHMLASHAMNVALGNLEPFPPVGSLVWNTYIRILDENRHPVADGNVGEIYIGGVGLAKGYIDPKLTTDLFVADPYQPGARLYRTRDRGTWRPDSTLALQGRIDDLIKIRGYSVEPCEVEEHLTRCPGVRRAAVFGVSHLDQGTELHAVVVGSAVSGLELRRTLLAVLPEYMVPVRWWLADTLPISPNGKLDRRALPGSSARSLPMVTRVG